MRLVKTYSPVRLEAASLRALALQACSYQSLKSILKRSLDRQTTLEKLHAINSTMSIPFAP